MPVELSTVVEALVTPFIALPDSAMNRPWTFEEYDEEGLRFALLQTGLELRELAVLTLEARSATHPPTTAQRIMAQYHAAGRDLTATLIGLSAADFKRAPAPEAWSIRQTFQHMLWAALSFLAVTRYALERQRSTDQRPIDPPDDVLDLLIEALNTQFGVGAYDDDSGSLAEVLARFDAIQALISTELGAVADRELEWPSVWWEGHEKPIRFRLLRFEAHLRQHTVQIEKTRQQLGYSITEAHWLIRQVYNALAEAEGAAFGVQIGGEVWQMRSALIETIRQRAAQVTALLNG